MVLFRGSPCQDPQAVNAAPQEQEEGPQLQGLAPAAPPHWALKEAREGSLEPVEEPSCLPPPLLLQRGSLRSRLPEDAGWGPGGELERGDRRLCRCLQTIPLVEELPEGLPSGASPAHKATKWVDYSNKFGFGYLLSNGSTAVLLPDGTHMAFCPQRQRICYHSEAEKAVSFGWREVPPWLATKRSVLRFFAQYMQRWLQEVNFYHDHTKIVLSCSDKGEELLTFMDHQRGSTTFPLDTLAQWGWTLPLHERVHYALRLLHCL